MDKKIIFGIASLPEREDLLKDCIESIYNQSDIIEVGLNNYKQIPDFLLKEKINVYLLDNSLGDAAKFYKLNQYTDHYYFSVDDDIVYPNNYVERMLGELDNSSVIGVHGSIFRNTYKDFYDRKIYNFRVGLEKGLYVDFIGTGTTLIDTSKVKIKLEDFKSPNMADVWLGIYCKENNIKPYIISRKDDWLKNNLKDLNIETIFGKKIKPDDKILNKLWKK